MVRTLQHLVNPSYSYLQYITQTSVSFAALALLLAAIQTIHKIVDNLTLSI